MSSPFADWTLEDARKTIADAIEQQAGGEDAFNANAAYVEDHDHWQDGSTWVGPLGGANTEVQRLVLDAVYRQFTPRDAMSEVLDRVANALLKREPDIDFIPLTPSPDAVIPEEATPEERDRMKAAAAAARTAQEAAAAEMKRVISAWWDRKKLWEKARSAVKRARWSGRGGLRTWIAPGNLEAAQVANPTEGSEETTGGGGSTHQLPSGLALEAAIMKVELSAPRPDVARVHLDEETQQAAGVFTFKEDDKGLAEVWFVQGEKTVLRILSDDGESAVEEFKLSLGGRLPIAEMETAQLITEPVRRQQNRLNFAESLMVRVAEVAGFPERYTINAESNGIWLETPPAGPALAQSVQNGKTYYLHSAPRTLGAAITTDLVGIIMKTDGGEQRATPGVQFKDPTDPEFAIKAARHAYFSMLEECKQGHLANDSTAEASGVAYEQARADYEADLEGVRVPLEGMIREIIEVAIAWAEAMSVPGTGGSFLERYRVSVTLNVNAGPITPDQQQQNNANVKAGTLSRTSAMASSGIEDVDAELQKILADPSALVELRSAQITAMVSLRGEGMSWERSAKILGIEDEALLLEFREADAEDEAAEAQGRTEGDEGDDIDDLLKGTGAKPPKKREPAGAGA